MSTPDYRKRAVKAEKRVAHLEDALERAMKAYRDTLYELVEVKTRLDVIRDSVNQPDGLQ